MTRCEVLTHGFKRAIANRVGESIVLIDPEPIVRDTIKAILEHQGYNVLPTDDPHSALHIVKTQNIALVITNVNLPGMSGHDAMRMLKHGNPRVPVLMVSGLPESEVIQHWIAEDGFYAFPKPFGAKDLADTVKHIVEESETRVGGSSA